MSEIDDLIKMSDEVTSENKEAKMEDLKAQLQPLADDLGILYDEKIKADAALKSINKRIIDQETKIRTLWGPHIIGTDKAVIDFGDYKLMTERSLNVSVAEEDNARDFAVEWLKENGYEDCLKWDVNTNTMKAIAGREFKESEVKIPGLKYSYFNKVKLS